MKWTLTIALFTATFQAVGSCDAPKDQKEANTCYTSASLSLNKSLALQIDEYGARLSASQVSQLHASQAAWESYRKAQCTFEASGAQDSPAYPEVHAQCAILMAQARLQLIRRIQYCKAGPIPCPVPWE
ncbi:lysozyme inhibitor LprI family protein [Hydrocarboniphaga sp.]|uniref:lysozyme inhibitor LprI family protein n=1 Tax=Hydrocarboniphaga sp. TaxID=2033016 RepID=UPI003D133CBA